VEDSPKPYPLDFDSLSRRLLLRYLVLASRHWSETGSPCLTVHATGNFAAPNYGGRARELQYTPANAMRNVFLELVKDPPDGYAVSLEATHHSPTQFRTPMFFAELGSSMREWKDDNAASYLASSIYHGILRDDRVPAAIGFGGGHYCPLFSAMETELAFGHICPKYALESLDENLIQQMIERTTDGVQKAVLDKGMRGDERKRILSTLSQIGSFDVIQKR